MTSGSETVIAESPAAAWAILEREMHLARDEFDEGAEWEQRPDDKPMTMIHVDDPGQPSETLTATQWVAKQGRGYFGSTEY